MELIAIPIVGLAGLYLISRDEARRKKALKEGFSDSTALPNTDFPDKNYSNESTVNESMNDMTSKLSTVNVYHGGSAYTDKYFAPDSTYSMKYGKTPSEFETPYKSLTGTTVPMTYFQHNNMQPYFGSKSHEIGPANSTESYLDNTTGQGSTHIEKKEQSPLFHPGDNYQFPNGFPNASEFVQSRINPSLRHANVQPFAKSQVQPGGQELLMARDTYGEKTVDELRPLNKQKGHGFTYGYEGPAKSTVTNRGIMGIQEKNRVEKSFESGRDRWFTTTGEHKAPTLRPIEVLHDVSRPETSQSYSGVANHSIPAEYVTGEYLDTHRQELGAMNMGPAYIPNHQNAYENDYGSKSHQIMSNNRTTGNNYGQSYFGSIKSALGSVIAPVLDTLRPSRKENVIGNLRPYQNAKSSVEGTYIYDPNDKPNTTMREISQHSKNHWNVNGIQSSNAYMNTPHQASDTYRAYTDPNSSYIGNANSTNAKEIRPYDSEYAYQSNDLRSSTVEHSGRMQSGNMNLLNSTMNIRSNANQERMLLNRRAADGQRHVETPSMQTMGIVQGNESMLYQNQQIDRNNGDVLSSLKSNPYSHNILHGL